MKSKSKVARDRKFIRFFKSRALYLLILMGVIIYLTQDDNILNIPTWLTIALVVISVGIIGLLFFPRYRKYSQFYTTEFKNFQFLDKVILLAGLTIMIVVLQSFLAIPINWLVKKKSTNSRIEYFDCRITNVITSGIDKIHFIFLDSKYSRYFDVGGSKRRELIDNYHLELGVRKSILNTYYLESMTLKPKIDTQYLKNLKH